jgi:hypothetical protein
MIGYVILAIPIGILVGLRLGAWLDRHTAKAPATNVTPGISMLAVDLNNTGATETNPQ